jgi:photosystem II stability/assembly factor-like uncharacterized protein
MKRSFILIIVFFALTNGHSQNWVIQNSGTPSDLSTVYFTNSVTGYAGGVTSPGTALMLKTTNGGTTWDSLSLGIIMGYLSAIVFTDVETGYAVGGGQFWYPPSSVGTILKTTDGGMTWNNSYPGLTHPLWSVQFPDKNTGYAVGFSSIYKTTNAGVSWDSLPVMNSYDLNSVFFTDSINGFMVADHGYIFKTVNGGSDWIIQNSGTTNYLNSVYFLNALTGYVVGGNGTILKTTNGGTDWVSLNSGTLSFLSSAYFTDSVTGYVVGQNGIILQTADGGVNWISQTMPAYWLRQVYFANPDTGYAVGAGGIILKTTNGGGVGIKENFSTSQVIKAFPNPANDNITIEVSDQSTKGNLSILNLNGQELLQQTITKHLTILDITTLPTGVYFLRLINNKQVQVGKIIKE